ncbi:MAG TPA: hypothetical protein VKG23_11280 [Thermoanaerobaculia bacterium]|jgi:hypothetical protein|nr:hypothetical protein [Thermoanaerobaculia bacterium]
MKRLFVVLACLAIASPAWAEKPRRIPQSPATPAAPATVTITGSPLTIVVGGDTSLQVYNSNVPGTGQFYPPNCTPGETADAGAFAGIGGIIYGPDFNNHPCGSAANTYTPWTPVSLSAVTGTGTTADPFTVVIVVNAGTAGVTLTETLTYVNGASTAVISLSFVAPPPPARPDAPGATVDAFVGSDLFLADSDAGFSFASASAAGGHGASSTCQQLQYTISWLGTTAATAWTAQGYSQVWQAISAGSLTDFVDPLCIDNGAALEWSGLTVGATPVVISTGVSFTGQAVPVGAVVPALSVTGLVVLVGLLAVVGFVLAKKSSLGA